MPRSKSPEGRILIDKSVLAAYVKSRAKAFGSQRRYARYLAESSGIKIHPMTVRYWSNEDTAPSQMDWKNVKILAADRGETLEETLVWLREVPSVHPLIEELMASPDSVIRAALKMCVERETALTAVTKKRVLKEIENASTRVESENLNGDASMVDIYGERITLLPKERQRLLKLISETARHERKTEEQFRSELKTAGVTDRTFKEIEGEGEHLFAFNEKTLSGLGKHLQSVSHWQGSEGLDPYVIDRKISGWDELRAILEMNGQRSLSC